MKTPVIVFLFLLSITGLSQNSRFNTSGRYTPVLTIGQVAAASGIIDLMPDLNRTIVMPYAERIELNRLMDRLRSANHNEGYYMFAEENFTTVFTTGNLNRVINYETIRISAFQNGMSNTCVSTGNMLTSQQKALLESADAGSNISIKVLYTYKGNEARRDLKEFNYEVTLVPEKEAMFPGGFRSLSDFLSREVFIKIKDDSASYQKVNRAIVKFTINEEGTVTNIQISNSSNDENIDRLLIKACGKMPRWSPACNARGEKVKQEFNMPFFGGGC